MKSPKLGRLNRSLPKNWKLPAGSANLLRAASEHRLSRSADSQSAKIWTFRRAVCFRLSWTSIFSVAIVFTSLTARGSSGSVTSVPSCSLRSYFLAITSHSGRIFLVARQFRFTRCRFIEFTSSARIELRRQGNVPAMGVVSSHGSA